MNTPGRLILIAGPCVIESEELCLRVASALKRTCDRLGIFYVFKASYDKANRTSAKSFRGPGLEQGLAVLAEVRARLAQTVNNTVDLDAGIVGNPGCGLGARPDQEVSRPDL